MMARQHDGVGKAMSSHLFNLSTGVSETNSLTNAKGVKEEEKERYEAFWEANRYFAGNYDSRRDFEMLDQEMVNHERGPAANRLFYLAVPPFVFEAVTANIRSSCMASK
jgi:glucose-6-phosphate 1-dehydrogenase